MAAAVAATVAASLLVAPTPASASFSPGTCTEYSVPVSLTDGGPVDQTLVGELCLPAFGTPKTVQLLVHGGSYNRTYWDFPYQPYLYSYRQYANAAGYATFNVDIVGTGESSRPHSSQVTMATSATALHQVITKLRAGALGPIAFRKVIWVGHSMGTATGWQEISTYGDVDGFIATGGAHTVSNTNAGGIAAFPASLDPKFAPLNLDDGYLSISKLDRDAVMYHGPTSSAQVRQVDYDTRDTYTVGVLVSGLGLFSQPLQDSVTKDITVPVLSIFGQQDVLYCATDAYDCDNLAAVQQSESSFYPNAADFDLVVVPQTGHDLNLHYTAPYSFLTMINWALTHVAP
ncbi:alpha/beta hydrolase [Micromonospora echinofusca]|uniref:Alpha/beta fold hydrolase n=1 Tax=Micromonospora echinofusca TaxID=47858 RepID=A0ABS3VPV3_MICEH|nr:alpha/beta hydrolase [Micromonospora echinofusca]MBO4206573.1 alpha/beta fold hydrolase [Micromonospora echinofusca]